MHSYRLAEGGEEQALPVLDRGTVVERERLSCHRRPVEAETRHRALPAETVKEEDHEKLRALGQGTAAVQQALLLQVVLVLTDLLEEVLGPPKPQTEKVSKPRIPMIRIITI